MLNQQFAKRFAAEWIDAWNTHDLDRVLANYADDCVMKSPLIVILAGEPSGRLRGKEAVRNYWTKGLQVMPNLHFTIADILCGVGSLTITYTAHRGLVAEVFEFGPDEKVMRASAHYVLE